MPKNGKYSIEDLDALVKLIVEATNLDEGQIAKSVNRNEGYISQSRSRKKVSDGFIDLLQMKYASELEELKIKRGQFFSPGIVSGSYKKDTKIRVTQDIDVEAFLVSTQVRHEAILQTILEFLAEIGAPQLKMPVTKVLSDLNKAVSTKEEELRTAAVKKAVL